MPVNDQKLNQSAAAQSNVSKQAPKRPNYSTDCTQQQSSDLQQQSTEGINGLVKAAATSEAVSLQRVDASLTNFEESMSDRLADRIGQVGTRVAALTLKKLQQRQPQVAHVDICADVENLLMSIDVPTLALPSVEVGK